LYGSTQVESPICTQYRLGVRFVRACHLALHHHPQSPLPPVKKYAIHALNIKFILQKFFCLKFCNFMFHILWKNCYISHKFSVSFINKEIFSCLTRIFSYFLAKYYLRNDKFLPVVYIFLTLLPQGGTVLSVCRGWRLFSRLLLISVRLSQKFVWMAYTSFLWLKFTSGSNLTTRYW
jgi:hypothetical protein